MRLSYSKCSRALALLGMNMLVSSYFHPTTNKLEYAAARLFLRSPSMNIARQQLTHAFLSRHPCASPSLHRALFNLVSLALLNLPSVLFSPYLLYLLSCYLTPL
jgi:hypothetical protein